MDPVATCCRRIYGANPLKKLPFCELERKKADKIFVILAYYYFVVIFFIVPLLQGRSQGTVSPLPDGPSYP